VVSESFVVLQIAYSATRLTLAGPEERGRLLVGRIGSRIGYLQGSKSIGKSYGSRPSQEREAK
jgi:hypothetical protein